MSSTSTPPQNHLSRLATRKLILRVTIWILRVLLALLLGVIAFNLEAGVALLTLGNTLDPAHMIALPPGLPQLVRLYEVLAIALALAVLMLRRSMLIVTIAEALLYGAAAWAAIAAAARIVSLNEAPTLVVEPILAGLLLMAYWILLRQVRP